MRTMELRIRAEWREGSAFEDQQPPAIRQGNRPHSPRIGTPATESASPAASPHPRHPQNNERHFRGDHQSRSKVNPDCYDSAAIRH